MKFKKIALLAAVGVSVLTVASCGDENAKKGEYTYNTYLSVSPSDWNELTYQDANDTNIMSYLGSSFFAYDFKFDSEGNIIDGEFTTNYDAATSLEDVTEDYAGQYGLDAKATENHAYKITLREDLKWHDGTAIDADDFVYTMQEQLNPLFKNYRADSFYNSGTVIHGAQDYVMQGSKVETASSKIMSLYGDAPAKNSQFARILSELYMYYYGKTSHYEVYHLKDDIQLSYESFLTNLVELNGIYYRKQKNEGLATMINRLQEKGMLPQRDSGSKVSRVITKMIGERNDKSHTGGKTLPHNEVVSQINEFLSLYLYTAYLNKIM